MEAQRRDLDLGIFAWLLLMRDLPAYCRNEAEGLLCAALLRWFIHPCASSRRNGQRHSFPEGEESRVLDTNGRDLACDALSRIHAHGLLIPAPVAAVCISVFGAFHHHPFVSESIPSPLSPAFPPSHLFVPLIYGGIEVRGRRING